VKDHRTGIEIHNIDPILEGNIQVFLDASANLA